MFKNYLAGIDGVAIYPVIAFVIFFVSFCLVLIVTITRRRDVMDEAAALPLSDDQTSVDLKSPSRYEDQ
jgi:cbb3-type cytochrome oxidase subunit 3